MTALSARWATEDERARWDELVIANPAGGDFLQSSTVAEAKIPHGMDPRYVVFEREHERVSVALFHERRIPALGRLWWGSRAPAVTTVNELENHVNALRRFIKAHVNGVFAVTFEPPVLSTPEVEQALDDSVSLTAPDIHRREGMQANLNTVQVPLLENDDELLAQFNRTTRKMIRRGERAGFEVVEYPPTQETFDRMHELMRMVGGGKDGLLLRPKSYMESLWKGFTSKGQGRFTAVEVDGAPAMLTFTIQYGSQAVYKDTGSVRDKTQQGMAHLINLDAMRTYRARGATVYDMFGVAPADAQSDADHVLFTSGKFKLGFGERVSHIGAFDLVVRKLPYRVWNRIGERAYAKLYRSRTGDFSIY
ncbi:GNAT family N-acetyltransferase [uncultured Agrococcus sp.]|uniref:lipid II:glycine glycyltransferase FemX n=1 Tax=uncultured Agrococcus sp. TaxID=382258 RepID=UPI0025EA71B4|nr:GNAT family N-acetyltransferase [uncultured Agrococcus sp.]